MSMSKSSKIMNLIEYRLRLTIKDGRELVGTFKAFDKHMNMILMDCEEHRRIRAKKSTGSEEREEKRTLGLVFIRGEEIVTFAVEGPPPQQENVFMAQPGPGSARAAARGLPTAPLGSAAIPRGMGGGLGAAGMQSMQPQVAASSQARISQQPRGMMPSGPRPGVRPMGMPPMGMPRAMPRPPMGMPMGMPRPPMGMPRGMARPMMGVRPPMGMPRGQ
eukprot:TRINITY_DN774322_c0_g1_i1.p1 TRINITY_DN774322_c0_g1~~TRINITY_DN774322_c0_g1_i1.p1  ORF type:complete len:218 (+),score=68.47 TRINITY_DN774322_c0_g1_i1:135-788(+)